MKITFVNKGEIPVSVGYTSIAAGRTTVVTGRSKADVAAAQLKGTKDFLVIAEPDPSDRGMAVVAQKNPAAPAADAVYLAGVGIELKDEAGSALSIAEKFGYAVFDDLACTIPSLTATLGTATTGSIQTGAGTNRITATTHTDGTFACRVTIPVAATKTVYLRAFGIAGGTRVLDASAIDTVAFSVS